MDIFSQLRSCVFRTRLLLGILNEFKLVELGKTNCKSKIFQIEHMSKLAGMMFHTFILLKGLKLWVRLKKCFLYFHCCSVV